MFKLANNLIKKILSVLLAIIRNGVLLTFCKQEKFACFFRCLLIFFQKAPFSIKLFQEYHHSECQTIWIQIWSDILSLLVWVDPNCSNLRLSANDTGRQI